MAANLTVYCLENVTDYFEFERLCHDLMSLEGYSSIEPLGAFKDKGRDAIHVNRSGETTIFAYSVREDWRAKLAEDAGKIRKHGHTCDQLNFVTTAQFTAGERDEAIDTIRREFNWYLELFGVERLRILPEERVAQDIFALTKLNYNACRLGDAEPVTVGFSDAVGEILISNPTVSERRPNFKYYI